MNDKLYNKLMELQQEIEIDKELSCGNYPADAYREAEIEIAEIESLLDISPIDSNYNDEELPFK